MIQLRIWLYLLELMVDFFQLNLKNPLLVAKQSYHTSSIALLIHRSSGNLSCCIFLNFDYGKILEISPAFNKHTVSNLFVHNQVVVSSQNQIDTFDVLGQFDVVVLHHVGQCNDEVAFILISQFVDHSSCKFNKGDVLAYLLVALV